MSHTSSDPDAATPRVEVEQSTAPATADTPTARFRRVLRAHDDGWPAVNMLAFDRVRERARATHAPWTLIGIWGEPPLAYDVVEASLCSRADVTVLVGHFVDGAKVRREPWHACVGLDRAFVETLVGAHTKACAFWIDPIADAVHVIDGTQPSRNLGRCHPGLIIQQLVERTGGQFLGFEDLQLAWSREVSEREARVVGNRSPREAPCEALVQLPTASAATRVPTVPPSTVPTSRSIREGVKEYYAELDRRFQVPDGYLGVPTGIDCIDKAGGIDAGELLVLAGPGGAGKTTVMVSMASAAARVGASGLYVTLAETRLKLIERVLTLTSGVPRARLRRGELRRQDLTDLTFAAASVSQLPLVVNDGIGATMSMPVLRELVRQWRESVTTERAFVVIDYLQLLHRARVQSLLELARESGVAILAVANIEDGDWQLERELRETATAMLVLTPPNHRETHHQLALVKHRRAPTSVEQLRFDVTSERFARPAR